MTKTLNLINYISIQNTKNKHSYLYMYREREREREKMIFFQQNQ